MFLMRAVAGLIVLNFVSFAQNLKPVSKYGDLPPVFEENRGQLDPQARYFLRGKNLNLFVTKTGAKLALRRGEQAAAVRMEVVGATGEGVVEGESPTGGQSSYFAGNDASKWVSGARQFEKVRIREVRRGVDLLCYANGNQFEYDLVVKPGTRAEDVKVRFSGAEKLSLTEEGDLRIQTAAGELIQHRPSVWQATARERRPVRSRYQLLRGGEVSVVVEPYDRQRELVIDPVISYSTLLGGSWNSLATAMVVDSAGNAYITGQTSSVDFPTTVGAYQVALKTGPGFSNVFVAKLNASGTALLYSTYLGGSYTDKAMALAVDLAGNAYVTGSTLSQDFPVTAGAYRASPLTLGGFVAKLNPSGTALVYSTYFEPGSGIQVDTGGNAYVAGSGASTADFPPAGGGYGSTPSSSGSGFVAKLNPSGTQLTFWAILNGCTASAVAIGNTGDIYVTGVTVADSNISATPGAFQQTGSAGYAYVAALSPDGVTLKASTYLGPANVPTYGYMGSALALDSTNNVYVVGSTSSKSFPTTGGAFMSTSPQDSAFEYHAFVSKLNPTLTTLVYSTYLGGISDDTANAVVVDSGGRAYVAGYSYSPNFPLTAGAVFSKKSDGPGSGYGEAFVTELDPSGSTLLYSTLLVGTGDDYAAAVAIDNAGGLFVAGFTSSSDFPVTGGAFQVSSKTTAPYGNAFVTKLDLTSQTTCSVSISPSSYVVPSGGGTSSFSVTAPPGCPWNAFDTSTRDVILNGPTNGIGNGTVSFTVASSINPNLSVPIYVGSATFLVLPKPTVLPSVFIENLAANARLQGKVLVTGWALENTAVVGPSAVFEVEAYIDNADANAATYYLPRPDVCAAFPGRTGCPYVGWSYSLNVSSLAVGSHTLTFTARDYSGNTSSSSVNFIANAIQPSLVIESPIANATLSGTVAINGWAIENTAVVGPAAVSSVTVFVDNTQIGTATYGIWRPDVCATFSGRLGCPNVGWTYNLNVGALSAGSHTLKIVATDTANNSSFSTVTFNANPIVPTLATESPAANATLTGTVALRGWAIENTAVVGPAAVSSVTIFVDNTQVGTATYGISRTDVCAAYPGRLGCPNVGWTYNLNVSALSAGAHTLKVVAADTSGNSTFNSLSFTAAAPTLVPTVYIDTPTVNATLSGPTTINGWALENTAAVGPAAVSSVNIYVDGNAVGTATYGTPRTDVCAAFPGRLGCPNVGWSYNLNVAAFTPGSHTLKVVATDSANNSSFSQISFIANALQPSIYLEGLAPNATLTGTTAIGGWAIENRDMVGANAISSVAVYVDSALVGAATYGIARPDVCAAFPGRLGCPNVGWSYSLSIASLTTGSHTLKVVATDTVGNSSFTQTSFTANAALLPSVYIEAPAANATLAGTVQIGGWALENRSSVGPDAISSVAVSVDGSFVGTAFYGIGRPDVCGAFPGRVGCPNVGWSYALNVSALASGSHTLTITATDSGGNQSSGQVLFVK